MTRTPDSFPGARIEESIVFISGSDFPVENGQVTYVSGVGFQFYEEGSIKTLSASNGVTATDHNKLAQLIHLAESGGPWQGYAGAIKETGPFPFHTASIWWTDATKTKKIVQKVITRNSNKAPVTVQWTAYQADGTTVAEMLTDTIYYNGVFEISRSRA